MRFDADGHLIYANPASARDPEGARRRRSATGCRRETLARFEAVAPARGFVEIVADSRTYAVWPVPIPDLGFTNLYGMDVTAERAIVKFPDQNPNPVFRIDWDGTLVYANPASAGLVAGLGLAIGATLPAGPPRGAAGARPGGRPRDGRGRGRRPHLRAAAGRRPRVRLHQRLRHRRDRGEGAGAARPRERAAAAQHPARADRPAPARRRAAHRRPLRRRHAPVRRHRRVHPPLVDDVAVRARRRPQRGLHASSTGSSTATASRR